MSPKSNKKHVVVAYSIYSLISLKRGAILAASLDFSDRTMIQTTNLNYISNHLWNNFLWVSYVDRQSLRDLRHIPSPCTNKLTKDIRKGRRHSFPIAHTFTCELLWLLSGPPGFTCLVSFAPVICFMYLCLNFISFLCLDLYVLGDDAWISKKS